MRTRHGRGIQGSSKGTLDLQAKLRGRFVHPLRRRTDWLHHPLREKGAAGSRGNFSPVTVYASRLTFQGKRIDVEASSEKLVLSKVAEHIYQALRTAPPSQEKAVEPPRGPTLWHGSPHRFDTFERVGENTRLGCTGRQQIRLWRRSTRGQRDGFIPFGPWTMRASWMRPASMSGVTCTI